MLIIYIIEDSYFNLVGVLFLYSLALTSCWTQS